MDKRPIILCVDNDPELLDVIEGQLTQEDYDLRRYGSGDELLEDLPALAACDLILLDVMMPGMDGFEVIQRIRKAHPRFLPIILITALGETEHKVRGLSTGATDFITKPTVSAELRARVRVHLHNVQLYKELERLDAMKDNLMRMIVHDLRNPLTSISLALQAMGTPPDPSILDAETWELTRQQMNYGLELCEQLLDITKLETDTLQVNLQGVSLKQTAEEAVAPLRLLAESK